MRSALAKEPVSSLNPNDITVEGATLDDDFGFRLGCHGRLFDRGADRVGAGRVRTEPLTVVADSPLTVVTGDDVLHGGTARSDLGSPKLDRIGLTHP